MASESRDSHRLNYFPSPFSAYSPAMMKPGNAVCNLIFISHASKNKNSPFAPRPCAFCGAHYQRAVGGRPDIVPLSPDKVAGSNTGLCLVAQLLQKRCLFCTSLSTIRISEFSFLLVEKTLLKRYRTYSPVNPAGFTCTHAEKTKETYRDIDVFLSVRHRGGDSPAVRGEGEGWTCCSQPPGNLSFFLSDVEGKLHFPTGGFAGIHQAVAVCYHRSLIHRVEGSRERKKRK